MVVKPKNGQQDLLISCL